MNNVDITSVQHLIDVRNQLDRYAAPEKVDWHLACINNRWTKRALASAGFGYPVPDGGSHAFQRWKPVFSVADIGGTDSAAHAAEVRETEMMRMRSVDLETGSRRKGSGKEETIEQDIASTSSGTGEVPGKAMFGKELDACKAYATVNKMAVVHGLNLPLFHIDLTSALQSAITNVEARREAEAV